MPNARRVDSSAQCVIQLQHTMQKCRNVVQTDWNNYNVNASWRSMAADRDDATWMRLRRLWIKSNQCNADTTSSQLADSTDDDGGDTIQHYTQHTNPINK